MRATVLNEPELEFGSGKHVDTRFGLLNHGPFDHFHALAPKQIKVGMVGTSSSIEAFGRFLANCADGIAAKESRQPNLFPPFPGYAQDGGLPATLVTDRLLEREIPPPEIASLVAKDLSQEKLVEEAVALFISEITVLAEANFADVIVCAPPVELLAKLDTAQSALKEGPFDFHDLLKAKAMRFHKGTQLILPATYDPETKYRRHDANKETRRLQDPATRAWNLYVALYYKANGTPWRLPKDPSSFDTCFLGISFFRTLDKLRLNTSVAQIFNERGDGVVVRGGPAQVSKEDRQPHLSINDAAELVIRALSAYRKVHKHAPARLVIHKSSLYTDEERRGFLAALNQQQIELFDFLKVGDSTTRLFRNGKYPPLRGTFLSLDEQTHVLYTRGSVDFFRTYPGMYVPRPLEFRCENNGTSPQRLAEEILGLTKMNWNNTQFDGAAPITLRAARQVARVLRYTDSNSSIEQRYSFYM